MEGGGVGGIGIVVAAILGRYPIPNPSLKNRSMKNTTKPTKKQPKNPTPITQPKLATYIHPSQSISPLNPPNLQPPQKQHHITNKSPQPSPPSPLLSRKHIKLNNFSKLLIFSLLPLLSVNFFIARKEVLTAFVTLGDFVSVVVVVGSVVRESLLR